jgi:hypothetical protein
VRFDGEAIRIAADGLRFDGDAICMAADVPRIEVELPRSRHEAQDDANEAS